MVKKWRVNILEFNENTQNLAKVLNGDLKIAGLLMERGISTFEEAKSFFRPSLNNLHDPFLMKDMLKAVERINLAFEKKEKIMVFGDYDVDGTSATALVFTFLKSKYDLLEYYIPDRYLEGYGISYKAIDIAQQKNISLIIALDCGIRAHDKIDYANQKNIDFIICDHHLPSETLPNAKAILDPKREDCQYPFKELSGCGVGFKLMQALCRKKNWDENELFDYLDLVAISIASDIVSITNENRTLAYFGLQKINEKPRIGIKALLEVSKKSDALNLSDLVFIIGPRINAAGRINTGMNAVELMVSNNYEAALETAKLISEDNNTRKDLDKTITQEALSMIFENENLQNKKTTVLFKNDWHKGVIGIVASRLIENFYRPTIMLTESNGKAVGSARSVKDFDVHEAICACADLLEQFGGHKAAAGLTLKIENVPLFQEKFEQIVAESITPEMLELTEEIDMELQFSDITQKFLNVLWQFDPFGPGNMNPVFVSRKVKQFSYARIIKDLHLKLFLFQDENPDLKFEAIGFNMIHFRDMLLENEFIDICYHIEANYFRGEKKIQLRIKDIKPSYA